MPIERKIIVKRYLLLCEGRDAERFLCAFLNSDALHDDLRFSDEIQVLDFGGNSELGNYLGALKNMDGFSEVTAIAILRDAETSFHKASGEVTRALERNGLPCPERCGVWKVDEAMPCVGYELFPLDGGAGTLEDLCLRILAEDNGDEIIRFIDSFLETMKRDYGRDYRRIHKNRLYTYFSTSDCYESMLLGVAADAGAFMWDSPKLNCLRDFLAKGFEA